MIVRGGKKLMNLFHKYFLGSGSGTVYPGYFPAAFVLVTSARAGERALRRAVSRSWDGFSPELLLASSPPAPLCPLLSRRCPLEFYFILFYWYGAAGPCPRSLPVPGGALCRASSATPYLGTAGTQGRVPKSCFLWFRRALCMTLFLTENPLFLPKLSVLSLG